jgi:hypothetical protein
MPDESIRIAYVVQDIIIPPSLKTDEERKRYMRLRCEEEQIRAKGGLKREFDRVTSKLDSENKV